MIREHEGNLLDQIEVGALDPSSDLTNLLRKCITLGGATGTERLREWATRELKGYGPNDELPPYRITRSLLFLDGYTMNAQIKGQQVPLNMIPEVVRESVQGDVHLPQPIAALVDLIESARRSGDEGIRLSPPHAPEMVALINHEIAKSDQRQFGFGGVSLPPSQVVERVYWSVNLSTFVAIVDSVRTTLVELVAEMRAGSPPGAELPSHDVAQQAVDIAINGKRNRITINQVAPGASGSAVTGGVGSSGEGLPESKSRRWMWWVAGVAGVVGSAAGVIAIFHH